MVDGAPATADSAYAAPAMAGERRVLDLSLVLDEPETPTEDCAAATDGEIVVCARPEEDQEQFRLRPLDTRFAGAAVPGDDNRLRTGLGDNAELMADTEQGSVGGWPSNRVMVRAKIRF